MPHNFKRDCLMSVSFRKLWKRTKLGAIKGPFHSHYPNTRVPMWATFMVRGDTRWVPVGGSAKDVALTKKIAKGIARGYKE